jgi:hypothetical protein
MAMLVGALTWMEENKYNFKLKFERKDESAKKLEDKSSEDGGGFKFPSWFTDSDYKEKQFLAGEEKTKIKFDELFASTLSTTNFEALSSILTKEDIELINVPGIICNNQRKLWTTRVQCEKN